MLAHSQSRLWRPLFMTFAIVALMASATPASAQEDTYSGSDLWLHYKPVTDTALLTQYKASATTIIVDNVDQNKVHRHTVNLSMAAGSTEKLVETSLQAARDELVRGLGGLWVSPSQCKPLPPTPSPTAPSSSAPAPVHRP